MHTEVNGSLRNTGSVKIWKHGSNNILNIAVLLGANLLEIIKFYEGWNFNSGNYLFTTDTK